MRRMLVTVVAGAVMTAGGGTASARQPASPRASCVAVITSYEGSQLPPASVGNEVSGLAGPGFGSTLVGPLAREHLGSIQTCFEAEA